MRYISDGNRGPFLSVAVFGLGLLASVTASRWISSHEHSEVHWATELAGQSIRSDIVTDMEWQMVGLDRLALLWKNADSPGPLWIKNAELYLQHRPGSVALEWLTPNGEPRGLIAKNGKPAATALAFDGVPTALLAAVRDSRVAMISAPALAAGGSRQWAIAYPVYIGDRLRGFIVSFFDLKESWDYILGDVAGLGFSYAVLMPDKTEYLLPSSTREHEQEWGEIVNVPLSGVTWQVRIWPKSDVVNVIKSSLPQVTLAGGLTLSLLVALTLHFAVGAARSSRRSRQANQILQREISMREGAQEELRRAHMELETRIDRRTAELAAANALMAREVTEHQRAEKMLQELTGRLFHLQDEERRRLARELHDGTVQNLVALAMDVGMLSEDISPGDASAKDRLRECVRLIEQSITELRTISYLLHPPYFDELGLPAALRDFTEGFANRSGIRVTLAMDPNVGRLGHDVELTIFRVVQEALSNVHRHAQSSTAVISLGRDDGLVRLEIADAGRGIPAEIMDPDRFSLAGVGLAGMRERVRLLGGVLDIQSTANGTTISAVLPVPSPDSIAGTGIAPAVSIGHA